MDTVNRYVSAASTALWGENTESQNIPHGNEPMSGVQGKGVADDPYDAGNRDEQPDAPKSDVDTAPQEPKLDGTPLNKAEPTMADNSFGAVAGGSGSGSGFNEYPMPKPTEFQAPEQRSTEESAVPKNQELGDQDQDTAESNAAESNTAEINTNESNTNESNTNESNIDTAESNTAESKDEVPAPSHNKEVSKEALMGPQGPAPKLAEQFEKEEKDKRKKPAESRSSGDSAPSSKSNNSNDKASNGSGSGSEKKHGTVAKMKETLNKVAHPRHGNNKA
ncbi:hypothetical protein N7486_005113 [Penicillium sp. IBT 16267x]|nr:hypothetical protein N7486_005113 [Penicillium sp. IBT 16267x]